MRTGLEVEQLFVRRRGGRLALLAVLENPAGARTREETMPPASDSAGAVEALARHLARRGDVDGAPRLRVRIERANGDLEDRPDLADRFRKAFEGERAADPA